MMSKRLIGVDRDLVVRRYMSLSKFEKLLSTGSMYFTRFDNFPDKLEGGITSQNYTDVSCALELFDLAMSSFPSSDGHSNSNALKDVMREVSNGTFEGLYGTQKRIDGDSYLKLVSSWLYATCWTDLPHECQAMWSLYGVTGIGCTHSERCVQCENTHGMSVCIETTVGAIIDNLELSDDYHFSVQKVDYIDHRNTKFGKDEISNRPFFSKAKHFSYEHEVRFVLWPNKVDVRFSYVRGESTANQQAHVLLGVKNMSSLIKKVILSPVSFQAAAKARKSHLEQYQSLLGLEENLSNKILKDKVVFLCKVNGVDVEIADSDMNQVGTSDCYTYRDDCE